MEKYGTGLIKFPWPLVFWGIDQMTSIVDYKNVLSFMEPFLNNTLYLIILLLVLLIFFYDKPFEVAIYVVGNILILKCYSNYTGIHCNVVIHIWNINDFQIVHINFSLLLHYILQKLFVPTSLICVTISFKSKAKFILLTTEKLIYVFFSLFSIFVCVRIIHSCVAILRIQLF